MGEPAKRRDLCGVRVVQGGQRQIGPEGDLGDTRRWGVHVTVVALCCSQVEGGSRPLAPPLWLARMIAAIRALGGFGLADADEAAWLCGFGLAAR
jgi:hypothetical protein